MSPKNLFEMQAIIKVIGVGGAGCNAVTRMVEADLEGVEFIAMNTDDQCLNKTLADEKVHLGTNLTRGRGTGGDPAKGESSAKESEKEILAHLEGADMVFIAAGMGGGTGTGAAPLIAQMAKRMGVLTIGIVSKPFDFEGPKRRTSAEHGLSNLRQSVDTLIVIPNQKLLTMLNRNVQIGDAFKMADNVLLQGVAGISDIIINAGDINVDFSDVRTVMKDGGLAVMGIGVGAGEHRARLAAEAAANSPLLETPLRGARKLLVNIKAGPDFTIGEAGDAMDYLAQFTDPDDANVFMGTTFDPDMNGEVMITLVATGMNEGSLPLDLNVYGNAAARERPTRRDVPAEARQPVREPQEAPATKPVDFNDKDFDLPSIIRKQKGIQ